MTDHGVLRERVGCCQLTLVITVIIVVLVAVVTLLARVQRAIRAEIWTLTVLWTDSTVRTDLARNTATEFALEGTTRIGLVILRTQITFFSGV